MSVGKYESLFSVILQGRVVRKSINAKPGLKVNQSTCIYFSCIEIFSTYVLSGLRLFKPKTEGQAI